MRDYRNNLAYQLARSLMVSVYEATGKIDPAVESSRPALALRRSVIGAAASLVEGSALASPVDYRRYLVAAREALAELPRQVNLCQLRGQLTPQAARDLLAQEVEARAALGTLIAETEALAS